MRPPNAVNTDAPRAPAGPGRLQREKERTCEGQPVSATRRPLRAEIPGGGQFLLTADAVEMISAFGGAQHCYDGPGGCRRSGLHFSRTQPKKALHCHLVAGDGARSDLIDPDGQPVSVGVSTVLAKVLNGATLDFGSCTGRQRLAWTRIPALRTPSCTCPRSIGAPAGQRSPCLDEENVAFNDL